MKIIIDDKTYTLIPLADEPKPDDKIEARLEYLEEKDKKTDERLDKLECDTQKLEYLRSEDRREVIEWLEAVESRLNKNDDEFVELADDVNLDLRLELHDLTKRLQALEQDVKNSEEWSEHVNSDLSQLVLQVRALEQFKQQMFTIREAVKPLGQPSYVGAGVKYEYAQRMELEEMESQSSQPSEIGRGLKHVPTTVSSGTQPSEKGVWVTRKALEMAFANGSRETRDSSIKKHDYDMWFTEMSRRLGLEE